MRKKRERGRNKLKKRRKRECDRGKKERSGGRERLCALVVDSNILFVNKVCRYRCLLLYKTWVNSTYIHQYG